MIAATPKAPTVFLPAAFWFLAGAVGEVVAEEPELVEAGLPVPGVVVAPLGVVLIIHIRSVQKTYHLEHQ